MCNEYYYEYLGHKKKTGITVSFNKEKEFVTHFKLTPGNYIMNALENISVTNVASTATVGNLSVASLPPTISLDVSVFLHNITTSKPLVNDHFAKNIMGALNMCVTDEYKITATFPNIKFGKKDLVLRTVLSSTFFLICVCGVT